MFDILDPFYSFLPLIKVFSAIISLFLGLGIVYVIFKFSGLGAKVEEYVDVAASHNFSKKRVVKVWSQIKKRLEAGDESNLKLAIIECDKVLDELLKLSGYPGETASDRLKQVTRAQLSNINDIWQAHRIRNRIAHEPDFEIGQHEAELAVKIYGRAFEELGLID